MEYTNFLHSSCYAKVKLDIIHKTNIRRLKEEVVLILWKPRNKIVASPLQVFFSFLTLKIPEMDLKKPPT